MRTQAVLEIDEGGGLTGHADVDRRTDRADVAHQLLGRRAQRPLHGGDGKQRVVPAGRLSRRNGGDVSQPVDLRTQGRGPR